MLWIDYEGSASPVQPELIYQLANKLQPGIITNNRLDVLHTDESHSMIGPNGDYATPEGFVAGYGNIPWETCTNMGHQWAWRWGDEPRGLQEIAHTVLRCVGGNGNLLLNVGPDSLGAFPATFCQRLKELGEWLKPIERQFYYAKILDFEIQYKQGKRWIKNKLSPLPQTKKAPAESSARATSVS